MGVSTSVPVSVFAHFDCSHLCPIANECQKPETHSDGDLCYASADVTLEKNSLKISVFHSGRERERAKEMRLFLATNCDRPTSYLYISKLLTSAKPSKESQRLAFLFRKAEERQKNIEDSPNFGETTRNHLPLSIS